MKWMKQTRAVVALLPERFKVLDVFRALELRMDSDREGVRTALYALAAAGELEAQALEGASGRDLEFRRASTFRAEEDVNPFALRDGSEFIQTLVLKWTRRREVEHAAG